jgi:predicted tellurium resistance membrane protein TerC
MSDNASSSKQSDTSRPNTPSYRQKTIQITPANLLRGVAIYLGLIILSLIAGFGFLLITMGFITLIPRLAGYWKPARTLINSLMNFPQEAPYNQVNPITGFTAIWLAIRLIISLLIVVFGLWIIVNQGFCRQNFFCGSLRFY